MKHVLLGLFTALGCSWAFLTGDWVVPSILSFVVVPAWYFAGEKGKKRLAEWQNR